MAGHPIQSGGDTMRAVSLISAEGATATHALGMPAVAFGLVAFGALVGLLLVTWAFRSVGSRH
jgi:hypothetical protein